MEKGRITHQLNKIIKQFDQKQLKVDFIKKRMENLNFFLKIEAKRKEEHFRNENFYEYI
jgi:hypothetical protein